MNYPSLLTVPGRSVTVAARIEELQHNFYASLNDGLYPECMDPGGAGTYHVNSTLRPHPHCIPFSKSSSIRA